MPNPLHLEDPDDTGSDRFPDRPTAKAKGRRGLIRKFFGGIGWLLLTPIGWAGTKSIWRGTSLIGDLSRTIRAKQTSARERVFVDDDRRLDLQATASSSGMSVPQLQERLAARRRQTALIAYAMFSLAWLFLIAWIRSALASPFTISRVMLALDFLPFCALFFLIAFYNALVNFQIRTGRRASWREYLASDERFLPR